MRAQDRQNQLTLDVLDAAWHHMTDWHLQNVYACCAATRSAWKCFSSGSEVSSPALDPPAAAAAAEEHSEAAAAAVQISSVKFCCVFDSNVNMPSMSRSFRNPALGSI